MRLIRKGNLKRLLTFTNGGHGDGWTNGRDAIRDVMAWYRAEGKEMLGDTPIVVVAERGTLGRWHVHGAIRAGYFIPYSRIIKSYSAHMTSIGYISSTDTHRFHSGDEHGKHKSGFTSARWCARYMAKYLAKTFEDERETHERRYKADGITPPEPDRMHPGNLADAEGCVNDTWTGATIEWFEDAEGKTAGFWFEWDAPP